ncbi:hypothetical protein GMRT_11494 [Giardia muris]|uniref:Uncharacterized protein n=1 Tax=Giardia muris TaxID=5742 RepID=A0A4Z1T2B8_GIAMU|nr:hypothetical protein GMRT_11494 [Giardia muris]|eukprot:TNJ29798.1 hypothetical protein GMRT_11494 [Giardia muris]
MVSPETYISETYSHVCELTGSIGTRLGLWRDGIHFFASLEVLYFHAQGKLPSKSPLIRKALQGVWEEYGQLMDAIITLYQRLKTAKYFVRFVPPFSEYHCWYLFQSTRRQYTYRTLQDEPPDAILLIVPKLSSEHLFTLRELMTRVAPIPVLVGVPSYGKLLLLSMPPLYAFQDVTKPRPK